MTWLAWRQLRAQGAVIVAALLVVVVALVATRSHLVAVYSATGDHELTGLYVWLRLLGTVLIALPAAIGAFWGAPMIASEFEGHTHRLAWAQSITRRRWLAVKLALTTAVSVAVVGIFAAVFTWWCAPLDATAASRVGPANFAQRGFISIGYTLFALTAGILIGAVTRRTLPAMAATLMAFLVTRLAIQKIVRPHLVAATTFRTDPFGPGPHGGWTLSTRTVDAAGQHVSGRDLENQLATACHITRATPDVNKALAACAHQRGIHNLTRAIPSGSFWQLQAIELVVFVGLSAFVVGATFWWIDHRTT
jgi:ABC-2 family transporter protein